MKQYSEAEKVELVLAALRNEASKAELCRQRGISTVGLDNWIKRFLEAGKAALSTSTKQNGQQKELQELQKENAALKHDLSEREMDIRILKKVTGQMPLSGSASK